MDQAQLSTLLGIGGPIGALAALVYVLQGPLKEILAYKARVQEAKNHKVDTARVIPSGALGEAVAVGTIREGLDGIAAAIREGNAAAGARDKDRLLKLTEELTEKLERLERETPAARR